MVTNKNMLIQRWNTIEGIALLENIARIIKRKKKLQDIPNLEYFEGLIDLRGLQADNLYSFKFSKLFQNSKFDKVDFSYSNLSGIWLENCEITNSIFKDVDFSGSYFRNPKFYFCKFYKVNFKYLFVYNIGLNGGDWHDIIFEKTNFDSVLLNFLSINNVYFLNCRFKMTFFDGTIFKDCTFEGEIYEADFYKYSRRYHKPFFFDYIKKKIPENKMLNVDFSKATLKHVYFERSLDLSNCIFPESFFEP